MPSSTLRPPGASRRPTRPNIRVIVDPRDATRDYFVTTDIAIDHLVEHLGTIECYSDGPDLYDPERKFGHLAASRIRRAGPSTKPAQPSAKPESP